MARIVPIRVISFLLLAACAALCQQREEGRSQNSLPDAPSAQASVFRTPADELGSPLTLPSSTHTASTRGALGGEALGIHESGPADGNREARLVFGRLDKPDRVEKESSDFFDKHLYPSLLKRGLNYHPSSSDNLMGRATYAASRIFVTRDESGKGRLNTSYFLGVLTSAAIHSAYRPYYRRSPSQPFNDFGSTIGNDAGMNLLHEFGPGLQQLMKSHAPKFVSRIEERLGHN